MRYGRDVLPSAESRAWTLVRRYRRARKNLGLPLHSGVYSRAHRLAQANRYEFGGWGEPEYIRPALAAYVREIRKAMGR
jgi:hypothetical protein